MRVIAQMDQEDLARWRLVMIKARALEINPGAYSQFETEQIVGDKMRLEIEFAKKYDLPVDSDWYFDPVTGNICVS